jgi:hypothetical protein
MYFMSIPNVWYNNVCNTYDSVYDEGKRVENVLYLWDNVYLIRYSDGTERQVLNDYVLSIVENEE